jgi:hypothetical protein
MTHVGDLLSLSDFACQRLRDRVADLTDAEYLWEPVPDCWTVRPEGDGSFRLEFEPGADPAPFTTIGWRLCHIIDCLQASRTATWIGVIPDPADGDPPVVGTAAEAVAALDRAVTIWRGRVAATDDAQLAEPIGELGGWFAEESRAAFVLHILDELIHHGAEVGVVRDLYRQH